jgi:hypothetical protein
MCDHTYTQRNCGACQHGRFESTLTPHEFESLLGSKYQWTDLQSRFGHGLISATTIPYRVTKKT